MEIADLVPELECLEFGISLDFYTRVLGFEIHFERPEQQFAFLKLGKAQIMLKQANGYWQTGPLERPLGRGLNLQITITDADALLRRLAKCGAPLFVGPETSWYRTGMTERGQTEFLVQDPDGYLLRFCEFLGERPVAQI